LIKVVHLSTVHARYDNRILFKQCVSLAKNGYETYLIIADGNGDEIFEEVRILDIGKNYGILDRMVRLTFLGYQKAIQINAAIYQIHDPELLPVALCLIKKGKQVIYDIHEDYFTSIQQKQYMPKFFRFVAAFLFRKFEMYVSKKLTIFIAEKYYKKKFPEAIEILNYPILPDVRPLITKKNLLNSKSLIYSGNVSEPRGAFIQTSLLKVLNDIQITFIGYCSVDLAHRIYAQIGSDENRFELIGKGNFISFSQIEEKYKSKNWLAGIAIFPKTLHYEKKELTKFFEYMVYGLPIICSDFENWKLFISKFGCGFAVDPRDFDSVKEVINFLYFNSDIRYSMGKKGQDAVYANFNWRNEEKKLLETYYKLTLIE
jgi:glycosyltransferase involved in cell wall biosynthesis